MKLAVKGIIFFIAGIGFAQDAYNCDGTTYQMWRCLSDIYEKADAELNETYRAAIKEFGHYQKPNRHIQNLQAAQRRWIAYRDAQCKAQYELFEGGTGGPLEQLACMIGMTQQRAAEIRHVYLSQR